MADQAAGEGAGAPGEAPTAGAPTAGAPATGTVAVEAGVVPARGSRKVVEGKVVSTKMQKTIAVEASFLKIHPRYKKFVKRYTKFKVHDENAEAREGDIVEIVSTRPLSKTKRYRLLRIVRRAEG